MPKRSNIFKRYTLVIIWAILWLLWFIFNADYADNDRVYDTQPQMYFSGK